MTLRTVKEKGESCASEGSLCTLVQGKEPNRTGDLVELRRQWSEFTDTKRAGICRQSIGERAP